MCHLRASVFTCQNMLLLLLLLLLSFVSTCFSDNFIEPRIWLHPHLRSYDTCKRALTEKQPVLFNVLKLGTLFRPEFLDVPSLMSNATQMLFRESHNFEIELWPQGRIPVILEDGMDEWKKRRIACAFLFFEEKTCVRFVKWRPDDKSVLLITTNDRRSGCFSETLGKLPGTGVQVVNLDAEFPHCWKHGSIVHELMHVTGLFHEQSREDRDDHVKVHWNNIPRFWRQQFFKGHELGLKLPTVGEYDFASRYLLDDMTRPTLSAKREPIGFNNRVMGNREEPTRKDMQKVNLLYCSDRASTTKKTTTRRTTPTTTGATTKRRTTTKTNNVDFASDVTCSQPEEAGYFCGETWITRYYFDSDRSLCLQFWYGGCGGNSNNFESISACQKRCQDLEPCDMKPDRGTWCGGYRLRYFYNKDNNRCDTFWFGGCDGNENNFENERLCQKKCAANGIVRRGSAVPFRCSLPRNFGVFCTFEKWSRRFYFDTRRGACRFFWYQGCGGNDNNFETLAECNQTCES